MSNECMSLPPLKPCPFCGGRAEVKERNVFGGIHYRAECLDCFAKTYHENTEKDAVEEWNRRPGESND